MMESVRSRLPLLVGSLTFMACSAAATAGYASRVQVEVHGVRTLHHLGFSQGIQSILVATALAIVALRVDTALAIPGLVVLPFAVAAIAVSARPARRTAC